MTTRQFAGLLAMIYTPFAMLALMGVSLRMIMITSITATAAFFILIYPDTKEEWRDEFWYRVGNLIEEGIQLVGALGFFGLFLACVLLILLPGLHRNWAGPGETLEYFWVITQITFASVLALILGGFLVRRQR